MRGSASSPSCAACPTTPTIVIHVESVEPRRAPNVMRLPIGSTCGKYFFTNCSSMIATCGRACRSLSSKTRPFLSGMRMRVEEARRHDADVAPRPVLARRARVSPSMLKLAVDQPPPNGITDVAPAAFTPADRVQSRHQLLRRTESAPCRCRTSRAANSRLNTSTLRGSNPGSTPCRPRHALDQAAPRRRAA